MGYHEDKAVFDEMLADWRVREARLTEDRRALDERGDALIDSRLAELTDVAIMADSELRTWLCQAAWSHPAAAVRQRALSGEGRHSLVDARDEYFSLPIPQICYDRDTNTAAEAVRLREWWKSWGLGRPDVKIKIRESTLSESGSYHIAWVPDAEPEATVRVTSYGHGRDLVTGTLETALVYVAKYHPQRLAQWDGVADDC